MTELALFARANLRYAAELEPTGAEDEISAESGGYAAQCQAKFFAA